MNGATISYRGKNYIRETELLGDVEKVRWYLEEEFIEIYNQNELDRLEDVYESICLASIIPPLFFI